MMTDLDDECDRLRRHRRVLEDLLDPDYGLLDQLLAMGALTRRDIHDVKSERTFERRNAQIIDYVSQHRCLGKLILALRNTNQNHLANYLISDGVKEPEFNDEWPLTDAQTAALNRNQQAFVDSLVDIDGLSMAMYSDEIINIRHKATIHAQPTPHEKSEVLLDLMIRHSQANHAKTIACLDETNDHVVRIIRSQGVVAQVTAKIEASEDEQMALDNEVAAGINSMLRDQSLPENVETISELKEEGLIGAKPGHSVALYFNCESSEELNRLWTLMNSGRLKDFVEKIVNRLRVTEHRHSVRLKWSKEDYAVKRAILNEVKISKNPSQSQHTEKVGLTITKDPSHPPESEKVTITRNPSQSPEAENVVSTESNLIVGTLRLPTRLFGVTQLNGLIYALGRSPNMVYVYSDEPPFSKMSEIRLETDLRFEGYDLCACSHSSCLYVSDSCAGRIFKIELGQGPIQMMSWLKSVRQPPWTLSVCRTTGNVLIARNEEPRGIELYDPMAELIYTVPLEAGILTLRHAISTSNGHFFVIHKWKDDPAWRLSEVNGKGETVHCFRHKKGPQSLGNPCHLAVDHDDRLIVLDQMKNKVVRFDHELNPQDTILTEKELQQPLRLCYDHRKRQLIVGQENGLIGIYSI